MNGTARPATRTTALALSGLLLLGGGSIAVAKNRESKWPIAMGEVTKVDSTKREIDIKDTDGKLMTFKVTSQTEIEQERERPVKFVWSADFSDLKEGQRVRMKYYGSGDPKIAKDIDIYLSAPTQ